MPTPKQIEAYKQIKQDGTFEQLPPEQQAKYSSIYEPIINPVSKTETFGRTFHQGVTGGFQDELGGVGGILGELVYDLSHGEKPSLDALGQTYTNTRDELRQKNEYAQASNPKTGYLGLGLGAIPTFIAAPLSVQGRLAKLGMAGVAGGVGGLGFGEREGVKGMAIDTGIGAGIGVGAELVLAGAGMAGVAASKSKSGRAILESADEAFPQLGRAVKKIMPSISETGRRAQNIEKIAQRRSQIANETIEDFVATNGGKVNDKVFKKAVEEGFPVATKQELVTMLASDKAAKDAGQRGIVRTMAMTPDELDGYMAQKFNFVPSKGAAPTPKVFDTPEDKLLMQKVGSELNEGVGTGSPDMTKFTPITPENVGGAPTKGKVGNLNINQIPTKYEDFRGWVQQMVDPNQELLQTARLKGKSSLSYDEASQMAESMGMDLNYFQKRKLGEAWAPHEAAFLQDTMQNKLYPDLISLRKKIDITDPKQKELWFNELGKVFQMQSNLAGGRSEAARTVSFAKRLNPLDKLREKAAKVFQENMTDPKAQERILKMADQLDLTSPEAIGNFISTLSRTPIQKLSGAAYELWINSILSSPMSHLRNLVGNTTTAVTVPFEKALASGFDAAITGGKKLLGKDAVRERFLNEATSTVSGNMVGLKQGTRSFFNSLAGKESAMGGTQKFVAGNMRSPFIPGKIGEVIRLPGNLLRAEDEFFKQFIYNGELTALATRQATKEGLKGKARDSLIASIIKNPSHEIHEAAIKAAQVGTFQNPLGKVGRTISYALKEIPVLKYVQPFLVTGANILKYGVKRTPLGLARLGKSGLAQGEVADILAQATMGTGALVGAGGGLSALRDIGSKKVDRPASQPDAKELSAWTMASGGLAQMYADGNLTGGAPEDSETKKTFYASGKIPYAVKIGDNWVQYKDLGPVGISMGIMADSMQAWNSLEREDSTKALGMMLFNASKTYLNQSYTSGLSDLFNAYSEPGRYLPKLMNRIATGFIPYSGAMRYAGNVVDPTLRRPEDLKQAAMAVLPWTKDMVPPMYDVWGNEIKFNGTAIERATSPIRRSPVNQDKATQEIDRLDIQPGSISKSINKDLQYTSPTYYLAQQMRGQYAKMFIDRFVNSKGYDKMDDISKSEVLDKLFSKAGEVTRKRLGVAGNSKAMKGLLMNLERATENNDEPLQETIKNRIKQVLSREFVGELPTSKETYSATPIETKREIK